MLINGEKRLNVNGTKRNVTKRNERYLSSKDLGKSKKFSLENKRSLRSLSVVEKARYLASKFKELGCANAEGSKLFFVKCFQRLSEDLIWSLYEEATKPSVKSPIAYFIASCKAQMRD